MRPSELQSDTIARARKLQNCINQGSFLRFFYCLKVSVAVVALCATLGCQSTSLLTTAGSDVTDEAGNSMISIIAGTYNQKGSEGIYTFAFDQSTQSFTAPKLIAKADNPSYLHINKGSLFTVKEVGNGALDLYQPSPSGLEMVSSQRTLGASPCYISQSPSGEYIATANYMGGSISIFGVNDDGLTTEPQLLQHSGRGPNKSRQEAAHAHWVQWSEDESQIYAVDLGIDKIIVYPFDSEAGVAGQGRDALTLSPGDGPRHMYFHPFKDFAYVLNELSNTISVANVLADGSMSVAQTVDMLPKEFNGHSQGGHLYVNTEGTRLYASNRGHDSIVVYAIDQTGLLSQIDIHSSGGKWPRHFLVLEDQGLILVGNQESDQVVALKLDEDGKITGSLAELSLPQVTFLGLWQ